MKRFVAALLLCAIVALASAALAAGDAVFINNPNPKDRLHLRESPSQSALSLGKYYNGAPMEALGAPQNGWVRVRVGDELGGQTGYMQSKYLLFLKAGETSPILNAMPSYVNKHDFYARQQPNRRAEKTPVMAGSVISLMGFTDEWWHVLIQGPDGGSDTGFVPANSSDLTKLGKDGLGNAYISNPNPSDRLHLRQTPSKDGTSLGKYYNGAIGTVLGYAQNGAWVKLSLYGREGYMQRKYLTLDGERNPTQYGIPTVNAIAAKPVLYEKPTTGARSKALKTGTSAEVLGIVDSVWLHVRTGAMTGFIKRSQTDFVDAR